MLFSQTFKNIRRSREVVRILVKYGFEDLVVNTPLRIFIPIRRRQNWFRKDQLVFETSRWERIRMATEELGATFIKGAQVLSNRPDLLPEELITEFQKLQSSVPPFAYEIVVQTIESELKQPLDSLFEWFDEFPVGAASIGQVHKAKLIDGTEVVVKIQRPNVKDVVLTDLNILKVIAKNGEKYFEKLGITNLMDVIDAFDKSMTKEMDYTNEARNIQQFRAYYKDTKDFYVPKVYKQFTTEKVMVLEMVKGCKITDVEQLKAWNISPESIAERGLNIYLTQIFEHGFFHADPHPGNILISNTGVIYLIDFGMVGKLSKRDKQAFAGVMISMAQQDPKRMGDYLMKLATESTVRNPRELESDLNELIEDFALLDVSESSFADLAARLQAIIYKYKMRVPGGVFIILRALAILEGIGKTIHPNFNTYDFIRPYGRKLILEEFSPKNVAFKLLTFGSNMASFATSFPVDAKDIMSKMRKGNLRIEVAPKDYEPFMRRLDMMTNRMSLTLIIFALLISSSVVMTTYPPADKIPLIPAIGFGLAGFFFLLLWRNMSKVKRRR